MAERRPIRKPVIEGDYPITDISVEVYKRRLGEDSLRRMLADDNDDGKKLRGRAEQYDSLTRDYLRVLSDMKLLKEPK